MLGKWSKRILKFIIGIHTIVIAIVSLTTDDDATKWMIYAIYLGIILLVFENRDEQ